MKLGTQIPSRTHDSYYQCLGQFADNDQCRFWSFDENMAQRHERVRRKRVTDQQHACVKVDIEQGQMMPEVERL